MKPLRRSLERFRSDPASMRHATAALVTVTAFVVLAGALTMRVFSPREYPTFGEALWFALQTATTVGYGDVTPESAIGRVVAGAVMVMAIGLITVVTGAITSVFVEAARTKAHRAERGEHDDVLKQVESTLATVAERLERLEAVLGEAAAAPSSESGADSSPG